MIINLGEYRGNKNAKVLSGRDVGNKYRQKLNLDHYDKTTETMEILIPEDIYAINSSYFLGLFGSSVRALGVESFRKKYIFKCDPILMKNVEDGILYAAKYA